MSCFAAVTAWIRLRAYSSVGGPTLESSPLIALVCAAGCINCSGYGCWVVVHSSCRAFSTLLGLDEPYSLIKGHPLVCLAKHIEANIVVSKSNNEGISDHLVTVGKLGAALAVDVILTHTRLTFEAGGESPCWFIPVLAHLLKVETGYHYLPPANSKRFYVAEESSFII